MENQTCITGYEYSGGQLSTTTQTCTPFNIAPRNIDYYWGFIITLSVFIAFWILGYKFAHK